MSNRLVVFVALLGLTVCAGHSQSVTEIVLPGPCAAAANASLPALEVARERLEREVTADTFALEASGGKLRDENDPRVKKLRKTQEDLLRVLFEMDCVERQRRRMEIAAKRGISSGATQAGKVIEVTTYYATNRNRSASSEPAAVYGSKVGTVLHYGRAIVTVPMTHAPGGLELPSLWRLEREPDPNRHFVLKSVVPLDTAVARAELKQKLEGSRSKALLVFVHGYNVGFGEAAMRTAQLAHDLKFSGVPLFFSWPSANKVIGYLQDAETAQLSEGVFEQLLEDLSLLPATDIYVVAHSMGNRIVTQALKARMDSGKKTSHLRELLLAAPDINADFFRAVIAPKLAAMQGTRITVYASSSDLALRASKAVHGFRRVGETAGGVFVYPGLETIDASSASLTMRNYGPLLPDGQLFGA